MSPLHARAPLPALFLLASLAACGGEDAASSGPPPGPTFKYPKDDELRVNHLQTKGTHNSYHIAPGDGTIVPLEYTHAPLDVQLAEQGVRQLELDVHWTAFTKSFAVYHEGFDKKTTCPTLKECLSLVQAFSAKHPAHHPLFIQIELKDTITEAEAEDYFARLEGEVLAVLPRERLLTPDDVRGGGASLREAIVSKGWPTLGATRGKVAFFIDNKSDAQMYYTRGHSDINGRLMFIDGEPSDPWAGVLLANDPISGASRIEECLSLGLMVRTRADSDNVQPLANDTSMRDAALASGAHFVSTDYPAKVDGVAYFVEVPEGTPSRCNPKTAPSGCASSDIEDPSFF